MHASRIEGDIILTRTATLKISWRLCLKLNAEKKACCDKKQQEKSDNSSRVKFSHVSSFC